ncbi:MAG: energy-dependent translational throttle protein EttA [Nitrospinota bacterium]|nr:energy-dependent translational throttle protein EttA [Nitrospinota bacterium]
MAGEYIFTINGLSKSHGSKTLFENINLSFYNDAKIGIVGENGSGKSTLLSIMAQQRTDFTGEAKPRKGVRIGYLPQEPTLSPGKTVRQNVEEAFSEIKGLIQDYEKISESMATGLSDDEMEKALEKMGKLQDRIDAVNGWELDHQVEIAMDALVLPPDDMEVEKLSGGETRRVALCKLLLQTPDMLLLDEPTNHLDAETVEWLEKALIDFPGNVIVVTHDRYFLDNITKWILELDNCRGIPFEGSYSAWLMAKAERLRLENRQSAPFFKHLERELDWINSGKGKSQGGSRVKEYQKLLSAGQKVEKNLQDIQIAPGPELGATVIEAQGLGMSYGDRSLFQNTDFIIPRGAIVGIMGPNGVGKTTLFRLITGQETPTTGKLNIGQSVQLSYVDQKREDLDGAKTVFEEIGGGTDLLEMGDVKINSRAYVAGFGFKGQDQQKKIKDLSGGERNRAHLAKLLRKGGNVLLLDEPTNDLDVASLRSLEDAILSFSGCAIVISHDRFFLDRVATHLLAFEGDGALRWFEGNYSEYEEARKKELGGKEESRRNKYKKLTIR